MLTTQISAALPASWLSSMEGKYPQKSESVVALLTTVGWEDNVQQQIEKLSFDKISTVVKSLRIKAIADKVQDVMSPTSSTTKKKKRKKKKKNGKPPPSPIAQGAVGRICKSLKNTQLNPSSLQHLMEVCFLSVCTDTEAVEVVQLLKESSKEIIGKLFSNATDAYSKPFTRIDYDFIGQMSSLRHQLAKCAAYPDNPNTSIIITGLLSAVERCDLALAILFCRRLHTPLNLLRQTTLMDISKAQWNSYSAFFSDRCATHGVIMTFRLLRRFILQQHQGLNLTPFNGLVIKELICRVVALVAARYLDLSPSCARARQVRFDAFHICREARSLRNFYNDKSTSLCVVGPLIDLLLFGILLDSPIPQLLSFFRNDPVEDSIPDELWMPPVFEPHLLNPLATPAISHEELTSIQVPVGFLLSKSSFTKAQLADIITRRWELWDVVPQTTEEDKQTLKAMAEILNQELSFEEWDSIRSKYVPLEEEPEPEEAQEQRQQPPTPEQVPVPNQKNPDQQPAVTDEPEEDEEEEEEEEDEEGEEGRKAA